MKALRIFVILILLTPGYANAATPAIKVLPANQTFNIPLSGASGDQVTSALITKNVIYLSATIESSTVKNSTAELLAYGFDGTKQWGLPIGIESIGSAISKDDQGNLFLLGLSVPAIAPTQPNQSPTGVLLNPDNVNAQPTYQPNSFKNLTVWKISPDGTLLQTFVKTLDEVVLPKSIKFDGAQFEIEVNSSNKNNFYNMDLAGNFNLQTTSKPISKIPSISIYKFGSNNLKYFISNGPIQGIPSWRPKKPLPVLIEYSKYGRIKSANYFPGTLISTYFLANYGFIALIETNSGFGISIVKPLS